jgi:hypothetical protein
VLFDKICRKNGITHRLTAPASPNQNGKVERFHGTFRPEISEAGPFTSLADAQAAVDAWVEHYNHERPHQGLDEKNPVVPADRFAAVANPLPDPAGVELWTPPALQITSQVPGAAPVEAGSADAAVELDKVVPASGNMSLCGSQFWLGPARAGQMVRFWIDCEWVHLSVGGQRLKSLRSRFSVSDLARLRSQGQFLQDPGRCPRDRDRVAAPEGRSWRSNAPSHVPEPCPWVLTWCWPRRSWPDVGSGSISRTAARCCSSIRSPASCSGPDQTRSPG